MRIARLQTVRASVATRICHYLGRGPEVNKFEQVSSDGHQMSPADWAGPGIPCLMSRKGPSSCTVRSNALWLMVTRGPPMDRQTCLKTLPSRNFVGGR